MTMFCASCTEERVFYFGITAVGLPIYWSGEGTPPGNLYGNVAIGLINYGLINYKHPSPPGGWREICDFLYRTVKTRPWLSLSLPPLLDAIIVYE